MGDFCDIQFDKKYDLVWCCHVLEHQLNVNLFLQKIFEVSNKFITVTVPPLKHEIVGGHLTLWNSGLLLYNLIMAGFDCKQARIFQYGYNISLITPKIEAKLPILNRDAGDIEKLNKFFPINVKQGFNGKNIGSYIYGNN